MSRESTRIFEFGPFRLIPQEHQLFNGDRQVPLTPKSFDLLKVLVENAGHLVEKSELLDKVWPDSFVEEANLSVKMSEVRKALGEAPNEQRYIETVPRRGYRFVAVVFERDNGNRQALNLDVGDAPETEESDLSERRPQDNSTGQRTSRRWPIITASGIVIFAAVIALDVGGLRTRFFEGSSVSGPIRSLAVLPLEDESGDISQDYFSVGMTDILIADLGKIRSLRVVSRPTVMQYKGTSKGLVQIANELNVDSLLTGTVSRSGERVKISVRLVDARTQKDLWANVYERELRDVLSMHGDVTRDIVQQIKIKASAEEQARIQNAAPVNPKAFEAFLRGRFHLYNHTEEENAAAINELENAVAIDPQFAAGHAELAQAYVWKQFLFSRNDKRLAESAYVEAEKSLALDPDLALGYLARGRALWTPSNKFPHLQAIRQYQRALELDPNLDEARNQLAIVYNHIGALDEAFQQLERAVETNPSNSQAQFRIGETLLFQCRFEEALATLRSMPSEANPALIGDQIVWALWSLGRKEEAAATLKQYLSKFPEDDRGLLTSIEAVMEAAAGNDQAAENKIRLAINKGKGFGHFHHTSFQIACAYATMNRPDKALEFLESAADEGFPCYPLFEKDPNLGKIRQDPRFAEFLERLRQQGKQYLPVS